jgi:GTP-binding protein
MLIHLIDVSGLSGRDPLADYDAINHELRAFDATLAEKPQIVVANKLDLAEGRAGYEAAQPRFAARGVALIGISAATGDGVGALMREVGRRWRALRAAEAPGAVPPSLRGAAEPTPSVE